MKNIRRSLLKLILTLPFTKAKAAEGKIEVLTLSDNGEALINPGMGWILYYYANSLKYYARDFQTISNSELKSFPGASVIYLRLAWSYLEPKEGQYNWDLLDKPIKKYVDAGFRIAMRITCSEIDRDQPYATPKWVFDAGAAFHRFDAGHPGVRNEFSGTNYEPDFGDKIFLAKLSNFLKVFSARYDGQSYLDFIDVGSYGVYGEGHTASSTQIEYQQETIKEHLQIYNNSFKKTKVIANHNYADNPYGKPRSWDAINLAKQMGMGFRDDSILVAGGRRAYYDQKMAAIFATDSPVIIETGEYSSRVKSGLWSTAELINAAKEYRASYVGAYWTPMGYLKQNSTAIDEINRFLGYRLTAKIIDAKIQESLFTGKISIRNIGIAPFLIKANLTIFLISPEGSFKLPVETSQIIGPIDSDKQVTTSFSLPIKDLKTPLDVGFFMKTSADIFINFPYSKNPGDQFYRIAKLKNIN